MAGTSIEQAIGEQEWVDRAAEPVRRAVSQVLARAPRVADALHGRWLGHPLHAALTDIPTGAWLTGLVLDAGEVFGGSRRLRRGADAAIAIGLVGSLGAAIAGVADWSETRGEAKRVGFVHGATNAVIAGLYGASLYARSRRRRGIGIALSTVGYGLVIFSAWLGGELAYRLGVGVRDEAFERKAAGRRAEHEPAGVTGGEPAGVTGGEPVGVARPAPESLVEEARAAEARGAGIEAGWGSARR